MRRLLLNAARALGWIALSLILLVSSMFVAAVVAARTDWGHEKLLAVVLPKLNDAVDGSVRIGRLGGHTPLRDLVLEDIEVDDREGQLVLRAERLSIRYKLVPLLLHRLEIDEVRVEGLRVRARHLSDGRLNLAALQKPSAPTPPSTNPMKIVLGHIVVDALVRYEPPLAPEGALAQGVSGRVRLSGTASLKGPTIDATVDAIAVETLLPAPARLAAHGGVSMSGGEIAFQSIVASLDGVGEEFSVLAPSAELTGPFHIQLRADGPSSRVAFQLEIRPPRGSVEVEGTLAGLGGPALSWSGNVTAHDLDPGAATRLAPHGTVELVASASGHDAQGSIHLARLEANALDARAVGSGDGTLDGYGRVDLSIQARDLSRFAAWAPGLGGALDAHAVISRSAEHLAIDARVHGARLRRQTIALAGLDLNLHSVDYLGDATVEARGLGAAGERLDTVHVKAHADRRGGTLVVDAQGPHRTALALAVHGKPLLHGDHVAGVDAQIDRLVASLKGARWQTEGAAHVRYDSVLAIERLSLKSGAQRVRLDGRYTPASKAIEASLSAHQVDVGQLIALVKDPPKTLTASVDAELHATGTTDRPIVDATVDAVASHVEKIDRVAAHAKAHYSANKVRGELAIKSAKLAAEGRFDLPLRAASDDPVALDFVVKSLPLTSLRSILPAAVADLDGTFSAHLRASGTLRAPVLAVDLHAADWQVGDVYVNGRLVKNDTVLAVAYRDNRLQVHESTRFGGDAGQIDLELALPIDLRTIMANPKEAIAKLERTAPLDGALTAKHLDLATLPFESVGFDRPVSRGVVDASFQLGGTVRDPSLNATVKAKGVDKDGVIDHIDGQVAVELRDGEARLTGQIDLRGQRLLDATGEARIRVADLLDHRPWKQGPLRLDVTIPDFDLARLRDMQPQLASLAGKLNAKVSVAGTFDSQSANVDLTVIGLQLDAARFTRFSLKGELAQRRLKATFDAAQESGGELHFDGAAPLDGAQPWKLAVQARRFDLKFLAGALEALRSARGTLEADVEVSGTRDKPSLEGHVAVAGGAFQLRIDPHPYDQIQLDVKVHPGKLELGKLSVKSGDGTLKASGYADLDGIHPIRLDLNAEAHRFALVLGTMAAWLDTSISVHGEGNAKHLRAQIDIHKGLVRLPKIGSDRKLQAIGESPRVKFVDRKARLDAAAEAKAAHGDATEAAFTVHIPGPFYIRSREANAELRGDLSLAVNGPDVSLTGSAETATGWIELIGQRYTIDRARVWFSGRPDNPDLDVRMSRQLSETVLIIEVHGTGAKPELDLRCDPPIYDKSQLLGIILSGDPAGQRVSDRGLDQKVVGAVSGLVLGKMKDAIAPSLPIDLIHVQTGDEGYTGVGQTRVEIGKYLTENLYISYIHQFGQPSTSAVTNSNEARVEYRFKRRYELDTSFGDAGVAGIDLYWTYRY